MLPEARFNSFTPPADKFYKETAVLKLDDLKPKSTNKPTISVMISTYNRQAQLQRSLECLARQTFRDFEVLLNDDGSTQDIQSIVKKFDPFINIQYFNTPRTSWVSCPSRAFKRMYEFATGKIIVVTHPEMMLSFDALQFIYDALLGNKLHNCSTYVIDNHASVEQSTWKWVSLRPNFFDDNTYIRMDGVDWHSNVDNIQYLGGWKNVVGFAGRPNSKHDVVPGYPWWFVGAALKECPIWLDTPITKGHANIDMFWCYYRKKYNFLDITPDKVMCYHQVHQISAVAPEGEQDFVIPVKDGAKCVYDW